MAQGILIADTIANMRDNLAGTATFLMVLNHPQFHSILESFGLDAGSTMHFGRRDGTKHPPLDVYASVSRIRGNPQFNLDYVGAFLMAVISLIADRLSHNAYFTKSPELEFVRHVRNAVAHGNRFHFRNDEPSRPARFRDFEIRRDLEGTVLFWEFMGPGDTLDLLQEVEAQLRAFEDQKL